MFRLKPDSLVFNGEKCHSVPSTEYNPCRFGTRVFGDVSQRFLQDTVQTKRLIRQHPAEIAVGCQLDRYAFAIGNRVALGAKGSCQTQVLQN